MASQSSVLFLICCLVSLLSLGLARRSQISPLPSKGIVECWAASFDLTKCAAELNKAVRGEPIELTTWPDCCKAAKSISDGCWPKVFPLDPLVPQLLKMYCPLFSLPSPPPMPTNAEESFMVSNLVDTPTLGDVDGP
ncbi:uncharacterized protein LOC143566352 [Bidens hawaiensis]|uniref:uncharacterized protein LOC143566352 n=1 Tax=Bidens hawaiensis TaxID=980011 RepID=UPI00404ABFD5